MLKTHPGIGIALWVALLVCALGIDHPVYALTQCFILTILVVRFDVKKTWQSMWSFIFFTALMVVLINPLVSQSGRTVLVLVRHIPVLGRLRITLEAVLYGGVMALKLVSVTWAFVLFSAMTDRDDMFTFMGGVLPKSTVLFSMTVNLVYRLQSEMSRVSEVMKMRGVQMEAKSLSRRIRAALPLVKVVIVSALDGSIDRAEALHVRAFGKGRRTQYKAVVLQRKDREMTVVLGFLIMIFLQTVISGSGHYSFYPTMENMGVKGLEYTRFILGWGVIYLCFQKMKIH